MKEVIINDENWYLVEILEKCEPLKSDLKKELRRVSTWGNYHLIKAKSPSHAFDKAMKIGEMNSFEFINTDKVEMKYEFLGIGDLLRIHENIEDGAEILWHDYGQISAKRALNMVRNKKDLIDNIKKK